MIAFSNTKLVPHFRDGAKAALRCIFEEDINGVFRAAIESVEEAILNSIFKADSMVGRDDNTRVALPLDQTREILARYGRLI